MAKKPPPFKGTAGARIRKGANFGVEREAYWAAMVPLAVAARQVQWERGAFVLRAHAAGMTYREIGVLFGGMSATRVMQILAKHRMCFVNSKRQRFSPVEEWYAKADDVKALAKMIKDQRVRAIRFRQEGWSYRPQRNWHKPILND